MSQTTILDALYRAFPDAQERVAAYLTAYAAYLAAPAEKRQERLNANLVAWRGMTEAEREDIDRVVQSVSLQVV